MITLPLLASKRIEPLMIQMPAPFLNTYFFNVLLVDLELLALVGALLVEHFCHLLQVNRLEYHFLWTTRENIF